MKNKSKQLNAKPTAAFQIHQTIANSLKPGSNNNSFSLQNAISPQETSKLSADAWALQLPGKKCDSTYPGESQQHMGNR